LFYGLFAAWVFWAEHHEPTDSEARFRWREAAGLLHIPILQKLFYDFSQPGPLGALRIDEVLDWAAEALNRVDRASFFATFEQSHAVQYFYEPFLEAFDPEMRKQLGVWYTPPEIVEYMVARVDQVLRSELGIADGLADPSVVVLDPCCGTGAYLVEVLNRIAKTVSEKGDDALLAHDLKQAAMSRIYGFEILPAPFVISHLQIGMLLHRLGAPFDDDSNERAGVYLTNALTGWDPPTAPKQHLLFTEMEEERDKAQAVKQHAPILVILGNPPYNGFAGAAMDEERDLVSAYRTVKKVAPPQGQGLNDLYVRFFRMAERRITEGSEGRGIVCFISNYSWLDGLSFTGMRERFLDVFDHIWIDCLNGDAYRTGKRTPEGKSDPSVFSTAKNREGIQVGTAVAMLTRRGAQVGRSDVRFKNHWGKGKLAELASFADESPSSDWQTLTPELDVGLPLRPSSVARGYAAWPTLPGLFPVFFPGVQTKRDEFLVDIDRANLERRLLAFFDPQLGDEEMARICPKAMADTPQYDAKRLRVALVKRGFLPQYVVRHAYRPFDLRWLYWEPDQPLLSRRVPDYFPNVFAGNRWLVSQQMPRRDWSRPQYITRLGCLDLMDRGASCIPMLLSAEHASATLLEPHTAESSVPNLSPEATNYLAGLDGSVESLFLGAMAVTHSPEYASENAGALRQDWPRIPLPATADALLASAELGRRVAALLDVEGPVDGVSTGQIRFELRPIGSIAKVDGGQVDPAAGDLAVTAGWGHAGQGGICMPGKGRLIERAYTEAELAGLREGMAALGLTFDQLMACLGGACVDVYLNERAYWRCVPRRVWSYTIGGYQVMKKWLSYRERPLLGRDLTADEARYVTEMARRIAALLLLEPALDENHARVKADTYEWSKTSTTAPVHSETE
jgi:predicted helicase